MTVKRLRDIVLRSRPNVTYHTDVMTLSTMTLVLTLVCFGAINVSSGRSISKAILRFVFQLFVVTL